MLPKKFKIANQEIKVEICDSLPNGDYGLWDDPTNTIKVARYIDDIELSKEQIYNSFYHELVHAFQFYFDNKYDEAQAQCYANFIREYLTTKEE